MTDPFVQASLVPQEDFSMQAISLFSGAGGMDRGFEDSGFRTALACEMDASAAATWRRNFSGAMHRGDVRLLLPTMTPGMADVLFGGPPCQGYSVAGKMDPADPRSALVFSFMEAVGRTRPLAFVMENVDALARLDKWSGTLADIRGTAAALGYATYVTVLDAADFGVPQARKRMFAWGSRTLSGEALALSVEAALSPLRGPRRNARTVFEALGPAGTDRNPIGSTAAVNFAKSPILRPSPYAGMLFNGAGRPVNPDAPAPTISASAGGNKTHIADEMQVFGDGTSFAAEYRRRISDGQGPMAGRAPPYLRRLTLKESAAFQTFPEGFVFEGSQSSVYRQIGNAVPCLLARAAATAAATILGEGGRLAA